MIKRNHHNKHHYNKYQSKQNYSTYDDELDSRIITLHKQDRDQSTYTTSHYNSEKTYNSSIYDSNVATSNADEQIGDASSESEYINDYI